ncbi:ABC transporter ATP-binding protein [Natronorubrum texcoconense]|uniref:Molybdate/tungstate import ATP-binding protein WtpC n=1 Tax=Natronorubrum texcoconense TaxID=1095776 RepID=A0A1G8VEQ1_9EURY|nr:ABC transporter ATP-binding protein [Natronorubrum texcoconense]SDJ64387.1 molybdate/tungstate transport system ATP-binding protein [Natronorubrum texcoconense]
MMLELESLTHRYGTESAVDDVSFGVAEGELVALLGPSGCGKTTVVQAVAGHVRPTAGRVTLRGADVTDAPPESRQVSVVFQQSTLYPHMTVSENVAYGLRARGVESGPRADVVSEYLELVDLSEQRDAYPAELSGGQRQRVELARAVAPEPDVLLLDEPLSALDRSLRERLRGEIARIQQETGVTTLFVTHDQAEAMALADRLVVMDDGSVAGVGEPRTLYESPSTPFVASFLGRSNELSATVVRQEPLTFTVGGQEVVLPDSRADGSIGSAVSCHVRPDDLTLDAGGGLGSDGPSVSLPGTVARVADMGCRYDVTVRLETEEEVIVERTETPPATGESVSVGLLAENLTIFGAGQRDRIGVDVARL